MLYISVRYVLLILNECFAHGVTLFFSVYGHPDSNIDLETGCSDTLYIYIHTHIYTGLFEIFVGVLTTCHTQYLVLQMQPHVISFYGVSRN